MLRHQAWIILVAGIVFFSGLGRPRLWDDDESKNARCAQEMLDRGDWVVPTFNFRLRPDKPVLYYWLAMISYTLFDVTEFAARFPSALLAIGTSLMTYHLGRRLFGSQAGLWAGLAMATNCMFAVAGRFATPDSTLIFCTTATLLAFVVGVEKASTWGKPERVDQAIVPRAWVYFGLMYSAAALALLAKGPVGVLVPAAAIGGFVLLEASRLRCRSSMRPEVVNVASQARFVASRTVSRLRGIVKAFPSIALAMRPLTFIAAIAVVALPWYACVALRTHGAWWQEFFWNHNVERFLQAREGHHGWLLFPPLTLMACFFPWSLFLPAAVLACVRRIRNASDDSPAYRLMLYWAGAWIVFFCICGTKQPNYILPAYPAIAVLVGRWIADWAAAVRLAPRSRRISAVWGALALAGVGVSVAIALAAQKIPALATYTWIGALPVCGSALAYTFERFRRPSFAMASLVASAALLLPLLIGGAAGPLSQQQNGVRIARLVAQLPARPSQLGQFRLAFVGLVYYANCKVEELATPDAAAALFADGKNPLIATDPQGFDELSVRRPGELQIVARQPRFGRNGDLILVARRAQPTVDVAATTSKAQSAKRR